MKKLLMIFTLVSSIAVLAILGAAYMTKQAQSGEPGTAGQGDTQNQRQVFLTPEVILPEKIQKALLKELDLKHLDTVYDMAYQKAVQKQVDKYKKAKSYTPQEPLLMLNPYGTNTTGLYIYFETKQRVNVKYEVSVKDESICNFTGSLYTNASGMPLAVQEGQIIGLMQGMTNYVVLYLYDGDGNLVQKEGYKIDVPDYGTVKEPKLAREQIGNTALMTDGLYCIFGYDRRNKKEPKHLLFYDNEGNIRAEIPLDVTIQDVKLERVDGNLFFACSPKQYAQVNSLGKVEKVYSIGKKYLSHHDFDVVGSIDKVVILADERSKGTKEDVVLALDLYTGETKKILDFEKLMPDIRKNARITEGSADQEYLDWIHFNTVDMINDTDMLLSSRETSTIMRVNNVFEKPELAWFAGDKAIWKGTKYEKLLLEKKGDFSSQAGQHTVTYLPDENLPEGQYYVYMFNNNYGVRDSNPEFDWSVIPGIGLPGKNAEYSYYYKYLVDENAGTYELVQKFALPYSSIVSSTQHYKGNIVTCSGMAGIFEEYDGAGKRIARFFMDVEMFTYRVFKYDMKGIWFANE